MKKLILFLAAGLLLGCPAVNDGDGSGGYPWADDPVVGPTSTPANTVNDPYWGGIRTVAPDAENSLASTDGWYKDAVFYHLWVNAFSDSNGDGIGDIQGIIDRLDYLQNDLGVTAIWLSPIFKTASSEANLHGYDTTDHYTVDPRFGSNYRLQTLIRELHSRGMRVIYDHVPNHVSSQHPWFTDSAASANGKRDWFIWKDTQPTPPEWTGWDSYSDFHGPRNGSYYYGIFWDGMPDLNYETLAVRTAMADVQIGWLNFGFDGIRMDAVKYVFEDSTNETNTGYSDQPATFEFWQKTRASIFEPYDSSNYFKFMVAENWTDDTDNLLKYMNDSGTDGFHMTLDFPFAYATASLNMSDLNSHWNWVKSTVEPAGGWMGTFTSNHDNVVSRPMTNFGNDAGRVRAQAALQMTGVGTPFIYYGNELGMTGAAGNDINLRQPIDWSNVTTQINQADSLLNWHQALITLRKNRVSLRRGSYTLVQNSGGIFAFERAHLGERTLVVVNLSGSTASPTVTLSAAPGGLVTLFGTNNVGGSGNNVTLTGMTGYAVRVIKLEGSGAETNLWPTDVAYAGETPPDMYVRGSVFSPVDWLSGAVMNYNSGVFSLTVNITTTGSKEFKFFNGTWYGLQNSSYDSSIGGDAGLTFTGNDNITFNVTTAGNHTFYFRLSDSKYSLDAP